MLRIALRFRGIFYRFTAPWIVLFGASWLAACATKEAVQPAAPSPPIAVKAAKVMEVSIAAPASVAPAAAPMAPAPAPALQAGVVQARMMPPAAMPALLPYSAQLPSLAKYQAFTDNPWQRAAEQPISTFSADVDTGSYANVRRFINRGQLPPKDAVRVEEMVNYFSYAYARPTVDHQHPFAVSLHSSASPWNVQRQLLRIGIAGKDVAKTQLPPANLVFLVDVSGSMAPQDRLPLVKSALKLLVQQMREQDRITLVSYANGTRLVLPATAGSQREVIQTAIDSLVASGGTYGEAGIRMAYAQAMQSFIIGGINRVLLATDGDLNIGVNDRNELKALVEEQRKKSVGLTTLGVGDTNYNEALMKTLADAGDGSYHYLDSLQEAHKVLINQFTSTLHTIAQDVKIQVEFNPALVSEYRLLGYELRGLTREQFNDDKVDAGDIGAGHQVTALYEIVPRGVQGNVDPLRYGKESAAANTASHLELAWIKLRYKTPGKPTSQLIELPVLAHAMGQGARFDSEAHFAAAVAAWAQWLRGSNLVGDYNPQQILAMAQLGKGEDRYGHRAEFMRLVELSSALKP
jgi:Ca-activated chloride channel homolog